MSGKFNIDGYVDVAQRIADFKAKFPDGSLQTELLRIEDGWFAKAYAYRTADDARPGIGHAFEPVPGKTPYTRDSECMNAETSAWGRAIVALGFETKHIASAEEVAAREAPKADNTESPYQPPAGAKPISKAQHGKIGGLVSRDKVVTVEELRAYMQEQFGKTSRADLTSKEASALIEWLLNKQAGLSGVGAASDDDIPF